MVLALCDIDTADAVKAEIVREMIAAGRPQDFVPKKPEMKIAVLSRQPPLEGDIGLQEFVGPRSWLIFHLLNINTDWMQHPPSEWSDLPAFNTFNDTVRMLKVVNDCAERSVKDVTEFINYGKDPYRLDRVMMVVNHHRQLIDFKNLTKAQMDAMDNYNVYLASGTCLGNRGYEPLHVNCKKS